MGPPQASFTAVWDKARSIPTPRGVYTSRSAPTQNTRAKASAAPAAPARDQRQRRRSGLEKKHTTASHSTTPTTASILLRPKVMALALRVAMFPTCPMSVKSPRDRGTEVMSTLK